MTYKASDIIKKAEQLSDLTNTDFITWDEKISLLNDAYTMLYQKLVNIGDGSFVKSFIAEPGENVLPHDFWQIKSVSLVNDKVVTPIKRRASSEGFASLSYEIRFDKLYINGTVFNGEIFIDYWSKPKTLTYKPSPVTLSPDVDGREIIGVDEERFFSLSGTILYMYDCKTEEEKSWDLGNNVSGAYAVIPNGNNEAIILTTGVLPFKKLDYELGIVSVLDKLVISESGQFSNIVNNQIKINNYPICDWTYENNAQIIACDDNYSDFFYTIKDTQAHPYAIYHNGNPITIGDYPVKAVALKYHNGTCWYYNDNEIGFIAPDDNVHILATTNKKIVGINKLDCNTGYGYTIGTTVYPWVEDTILDFPNSMYFQVMAYMLAVQFKIKQGADAQGLMSVLGTLENTFYDTLTQDANDFVRIRNVY